MESKDIVFAAANAHKSHWRETRARPDGQKVAAKVTSEWQKAVQQSDPTRFIIDAPVAAHLRESLALFDSRDGVAYEFGLSRNNLDCELYRDLFKAWVAKHHSQPSLKSLVFIATEPASNKLRSGLAKDVMSAGTTLGVGLEFAFIRTRKITR